MSLAAAPHRPWQLPVELGRPAHGPEANPSATRPFRGRRLHRRPGRLVETLLGGAAEAMRRSRRGRAGGARCRGRRDRRLATPGGTPASPAFAATAGRSSSPTPAFGLRAALTAVARLARRRAGLATRAAIGVGRVEQPRHRGLAEARGPAFEASGRGLDACGRPAARDRRRGRRRAPLHRAVVELLDERAARWTPAAGRGDAPSTSPRRSDARASIAAAARHHRRRRSSNYRVAGAGRQRGAAARWRTDERTGAINLLLEYSLLACSRRQLARGDA